MQPPFYNPASDKPPHASSGDSRTPHSYTIRPAVSAPRSYDVRAIGRQVVVGMPGKTGIETSVRSRAKARN